MKKILLFVSIVFLALFSEKTNAQTIDSLVISQFIECPGLTASLDVFISQTAPPVPYNIVLQKMNGIGSAYILVTEESNTSVTSHTFSALFGADLYRVLLVDPTLPQSAYPSTTSDPTVNNSSIYSYSGVFIGSPANLTISISDDSLLCWYDTTATLTVNILNGGTPPYTITLAGVQTVILPSNISSVDFPNLPAGTYNYVKPAVGTANVFIKAGNYDLDALGRMITEQISGAKTTN